MGSKLADEFIRLGQQLSEEQAAAGDLWTWLPSHKVAERHHNDYALEFAPSVKDIMVEAAMYLAFIKQPRDVTTEEKEWFTRCPCGEEHEVVKVDSDGK